VWENEPQSPYARIAFFALAAIGSASLAWLELVVNVDDIPLVVTIRFKLLIETMGK